MTNEDPFSPRDDVNSPTDKSQEEIPGEDNNFSSFSLYDTIASQAQDSLSLVEKTLGHEILAMANMSLLPSALTALPTMNLPKLTEIATTPHLPSLDLMSRVCESLEDSVNSRIGYELQSALQPINTTLGDNLHSTANTFSAYLTPILDAHVKGIEQSFKSVLPNWEELTSPMLMSPALNALEDVLHSTANTFSAYPNLMLDAHVKGIEQSFKSVLPNWEGLTSPMLMSPALNALEDVLHSTANAFSAYPNLMLDAHMKGIEQSFKSVLPNWEELTSPMLMSPALNVMNQFSSMTTFFPDMSWVLDLTGHLNTILSTFCDYSSLDFGLLKKWIRQRIVAAFRLAGFCFAPSMSEELMYQIADLIETSGKLSSVTLLIWNYYARCNHARLQQTVERWQDNPVYARRWQQILLPAFEAHRRGEYGLSISALTPLVEGISSHVVKKNTLVPAKKPKRGLLGLGSTESVILRALKTAGDEANLECDTTDIAHWVRVKSVLGYVEDVFCESLEFERDYDLIHLNNRKLHRHGLLHGIQINAMTALNSLRLFLLLDTIHGLLQTYIAKGGIV